MTNTRLHRELLKQQLMNYDYSDTPVNKMILVELDYSQITTQSEGPDGFTHAKSSGGTTEKLIETMNREVSRHPEYDLIIVDKSNEVW
tara:strand:+ start:731 stop:994 length:264 start_codon:yes stop_codon:yes gene_type:complete